MTEKDFYKLVDVKYQQYIDWNYDLDAIMYESNMIKGTPDILFEHGADEKEACLFALDQLENNILDILINQHWCWDSVI